MKYDGQNRDDSEKKMLDAPERLTNCRIVRKVKITSLVMTALVLITLFILFPAMKEYFYFTSANAWLWVGLWIVTVLVLYSFFYFIITIESRRFIANLKYSRYGIEFKGNFFRWQEIKKQ